METSVLRPRGRTPHRTMTLRGVRSSVESPGFPTPCPRDLARPATAPTYRWGRLEGARPRPGPQPPRTAGHFSKAHVPTPGPSARCPLHPRRASAVRSHLTHIRVDRHFVPDALGSAL